MLNRQSPMTTIAYCNYTKWKNQLKIANHVTVGKKALPHLTASASLNALYIKQKVTETTSNNQETCIGLTENEFKTRFNLHKSSFKLEHKRTSTTFSDHVWKLKKKNINFNIKWQVVKRVKPFAPSNKVCGLCWQEKLSIFRSAPSLNKRSEIVGHCIHRKKFLLSYLSMSTDEVSIADRNSNPSRPFIQKEYSDDGLSGYTVSSLKAVRHRYMVFVFIVSSAFFSACSLGLVYLGPKAGWRAATTS